MSSELDPQSAKAIAPASVANIGVGFDALGMAFGVAYDRVVATRTEEPGVRLGAVSGLYKTLPTDPDKNTALRGVAALLADKAPDFGVTIDLEKGVPMSSGMGGSAASAVASVVAANAVLPAPLSTEELFPYAVEGETASSDNPPLDNVAGSLFGGVCLISPQDYGAAVQLPAVDGVSCLLIHPDLKAETREGRRILPEELPFETAVDHGRRLANFIAACYTNDVSLMRASMKELLAEPTRGPTFPHFAAVQAAAIESGAIASSLSGSGPSVFAWVETPNAETVGQAMRAAQDATGIPYTFYEAPLYSEGAKVVSE